MKLSMLAGVAALCLVSRPGLASDMENAPEPFMLGADQVVPADFQRVDLDLTFDYRARRAKGSAVVSFEVDQPGFPMFDLVPRVTRLVLDGVELPSSMLETVFVPDRATQLRVLKNVVSAGTLHVMEIDYDLSSEVSFSSGNVRAGFFMTDLRVGGRGFWEQYGPASFEWDHFTQIVTTTIEGVSKNHTLYANGDVTMLGPNSWQVVYPSYFTTSSFYYHLTEAGRFREASVTYNGLERPIDVTVYAESAGLVNSGMRNSLSVLAELEATYGPYAHANALVYVTPGGGGMEYAGATMTSLGALEHEFTHFWFARGVMPANGNAGWIDEAVASWRDNRYPRAARPPSGSPRHLGGFSQYRRDTTRDAYTLGAKLMSELDKQFEDYMFEGQRGMRGILRGLFGEKQRQSITVQYFKLFLEETTGADLTATFDRYVYGRALHGDDCGEENPCLEKGLAISHHPRPYTVEEMRDYR